MTSTPSARHPAQRRFTALLVSAIIFVAGGMAVEFMQYQETQRLEESISQRVTSQAGEVRAVLEAELNANLHLTSGLVSYIQVREGRLNRDEIEPWLSGLVRQGRHIRNIGIAPGNRITYIYPLAGNEGALGLYYPDSPAQWPAVELAIRQQRPLLAGPVQLKQGGTGLIYRVPVFLNDGSYWGIISTVINADQLFAIVSRMAKERRISIALAPTGGRPDQPMLVGSAQDLATALVRLEVLVPGGEWTLGASAKPGSGAMPQASWLRAIGWLLAFVLAVLVFLLLQAASRRNVMLEALAASRQRFTRAFETAPQGMALLDLEGHWLDANDVLCQLLGYSRDELRTQTLSGLTHPDDRPLDAAGVAALLEKHTRSEQWEKRLLAKTGESIDCLFSVALVDSQPPYLIAQVQDMREYKRLARMKNEFVSTVSHELRTPLTAISGSLGLITGGALGDPPAEMKPMLEIANRNSLRLTELINDLLDMEKLSAGKMAFDARDQALKPLLEEALASNHAYAALYGVQFRLETPCNAWVHVDAKRLQQVLANYLSNAAKFSPTGSTVSVGVTCAGQRVRVEVRDTGPGIPDDFRDRIFQKFSQADASDRRTKGGTGLGLAITKELVEHMGGIVGFDSSPGKGSTFWFELPALSPVE